jgi:hypothetical protein
LIVPVTVGGTISSLQFIDGAGAKLFLPGGAVKGGSYTIGDLTEATTILICEGFATGASLREAICLPVVVAFSASNLAPVAKHLRQQFPTPMLVIGSDNDRGGTGQQAAREAAEAVGGMVARPEELGQDFNDVHVQRGLDAVKEAITTAISAAQPPIPNRSEGTAVAPDVGPAEREPDGTDEYARVNRPELDRDIGDLDEITCQAWDTIQISNWPPQLFLYGSVASRIELDEVGRSLRIVELTTDRLRYHAAQLARWTRTKNRERVECRPPMDVIKNMLAAPEIPLPILLRIVEVPVFTGNGELVQRPGYDPEARIIYQPYAPNVSIAIPAKPTADELLAAKARLDEVLEDFPFVSDADRAHAIALGILPFVRDLIDGPTPLHMAEAACPGSGKTLLVEALLYPSVGRRIGAIAEARDDEEWRKRLTARLREGCPVTLIDNLSRPLDSGTVSAVLTARRWEDRLLGKTETIAVPVRTIFVCTANNPTLSLEIARRSIRIRLDPKMDRPWLRDGFRHPDLRTFVEQERPVLIAALLTLVQGWLKAGRPKPAAKPLGSFEAWSNIVGGGVEFAGFKNFLGNALEFYEAADSDGAILRLFITSWWNTHQSRTVSVKDLFDIATSIDGFYLGRGSSERGQKTVLGHQLKKHRDQIVGGFRLMEVGTYANGTQWRLQQITTSAPESESVEGIEEITLK